MRQNGEFRTCDRCKCTEFFKTIGDGETDGGYTRWNKFEPADGWSVEHGIGDLCPDCTREFEKMKRNFAVECKKFLTEEEE